MFNGKSWITSLGGLICLAGGSVILWKMVFLNAPVDEEHLALLAFCFGGALTGFGAKQFNVTTNPITNKNESIK